MKKIAPIIIALMAFAATGRAQTFFETAEGDGVIIGIDSQDVYQAKINSSSKSLSVGLYRRTGDATDATRWLFSAEASVKPNDDGVATLFTKGKIEPGVEISAEIGKRWNDNTMLPFFNVLDIYLKPTYKYGSARLFDSTRAKYGSPTVYDSVFHSFGLNLLTNLFISPGSMNIMLGAQIGILSTTNTEDLDEVFVQTIKPIANDTGSNYVLSEAAKGKMGKVERITTAPLKIDLIIDPQIHLFGSGTTNATLGFLGYFRRDLGKTNPTSRVGFGLCLLNAKNPSQVFSSIGYELPEIGGGDPVKFHKGTIFMSIGYTIL